MWLSVVDLCLGLACCSNVTTLVSNALISIRSLMWTFVSKSVTCVNESSIFGMGIGGDLGRSLVDGSWIGRIVLC